MGTIEAFDKRIHDTFAKCQAQGKLSRVKGNFSIIVHEVAQWTVIVRGPKAGVYRELQDDDMDFILITTSEVFDKMNKPLEDRAANDELDHEQIIADGKLAMHGDVEIYEQFIALAEANDAASSRSKGRAPRLDNGRKKRSRKLI